MELVEPTNPALTKKSILIEMGADVSGLIDEMFTLMRLKFGAGLAAPQVGINKKIFVTSFEGHKVFINPKIIKKIGPLKKDDERCLSLPNISVPVVRHEKVYVEYYDENWLHRKEVHGGMLARVIQHEQDHLNGKLITDYL